MTKWIQALVGLAAIGWLALAIAGCSFQHGAEFIPVDGGSLPNAYPCTCTCSVKTSTPTLDIVQSADDAEENSNDLSENLTGLVLELGQAATPDVVGLRFENVQVPPGVTIQSAFLQFTAAGSNGNVANLTVVGEAADSAEANTTAPGSLSGRPVTTNTTAWAPPSWTAGDTLAAERTPDLSAILNEIVSRPGWALGNAIGIGIYGTGLRRAVSFDRDPNHAPQLLLTFTVAGSTVTKTLDVCEPDALNPSISDAGVEPNGNDLSNDCENRVAQTLGDLDNACGYPSACNCKLPDVYVTHYSDSCASPCAEDPLDPTCSNFTPDGGTATNVTGDKPVCLVHSPITAEVFGQLSSCNVSGQISFHTDDESKTSATHGEIDFTGRPCPGGTCAVGMGYVLDAASMTFDSLFGSATFRNLAGVGENTSGNLAQLASDGTGSFGSGATVNAGRGTRGSDSMALVGNNLEPIDVTVDWAGKSCTVSGTLVGSVDPELKRCENAGPSANAVCTQDSDCVDDPGCSDGVCNCLPVGRTNTSLAVDVTGTLVNQPPSIQAGADQVVECNAPRAGIFTLAATASDPDNNAHLYTWFLGGRTGPAVGYASTVRTSQPVGTTEAYLAQVVDSHMQAADSTTHVQVVDTTAPVISCNAAPTIGPASQPVSFRATASDVCDPDATPVLTDFSCFRVNGSGKVVDKTHACSVLLEGDTITIRRTNGVGEHVQWTAEVTDASGNSASTTCETVVAAP